MARHQPQIRVLQSTKHFFLPQCLQQPANTTFSSTPHRILVLKISFYLLPLISWLGMHTWSLLMKLKEQSQSTFSMLAGTGGGTLASTSHYPCMHARR